MCFSSEVCKIFYKQSKGSFLPVHKNLWSAVSGKSPTKGDNRQTKEGAEGGVERLDLSRGP